MAGDKKSPEEQVTLPTYSPLNISSAIKLPPFWTTRPTLWFIQVETQFRLRGISQSSTKYDYLLSSLPPESMEIVADFITNRDFEGDSYEAIKKLLILRCQDTEEKRLDSLLNKMELGDLKPSELFRNMETLAGGNSLINRSLLNKLWLNKLPASMQACIIAIEGTHQQEDIFRIADRIYDSSERHNVSSVNVNKNIEEKLDDICRRISNLEMNLNRSRSRNRRGNSQYEFSRSNSRSKYDNKLCYYHKKFANKATKCQAGCTFNSKAQTFSDLGHSSKN